MIRHATLEDIPAILIMGKAFADEAGVTGVVGWDEGNVASLLTSMIEHEDGLMVIGEQTILGGVAYAHPFNHATKIFQEMFWRSHGREGIHALKFAEQWMQERGVSHSFMLGLDAMPNLDRFYSRLGYRAAERTFVKGF